MTDHLQYLMTVLEVLSSNQLCAKKSKCLFASGEVEYLVHIITGNGVKANPMKTAAMQQ